MKEDCFIVVASDGVWEFLENLEVVKIIGQYYDGYMLDEACD